jgi:hypothetical protein
MNNTKAMGVLAGMSLVEEFAGQPFVCNSSQSTDQCGKLTLTGVRRVHDPHHFINGERYFSRMTFRNRHGKVSRSFTRSATAGSGARVARVRPAVSSRRSRAPRESLRHLRQLPWVHPGSRRVPDPTSYPGSRALRARLKVSR